MTATIDLDRARTPIVNGWCATGRHHLCPQTPGGGVNPSTSHRWLEWHRCTCNCHTAQQRLFGEDTA